MFEYNLTGEKVKAIITDPDQIALQELSNKGLHCDILHRARLDNQNFSDKCQNF